MTIQSREIYRGASMVGLVALVVSLSGCIEYQIETTLRADGSGVRLEKMIVEEFEDEADNDPFRTIFGYLMFVTEDFRWEHRQEVRDGDTLQIFVRETEVRDLASWTDLSGRVHIAGTVGSSTASIGNVALGDVHFRNRVRVETGRVSGGTSFTYRESFYWENLADALIEYLVQSFADSVVAVYPNLSPEQRRELEALVRGSAWFAVGQGLFDAGGDEEKALLSALAARTAGRAKRIVERRYPDVQEDFFEGVLERIYDDEDGRFEDFLKEKLPGVALAINSEIVLRLNIPGRVTSSNAHDRDGDTLIWEFAPGDALTAALEIVAESVVER